VSVSKLLSLNLFGEYNKVIEAPKPVVQQTSAPKTRLNVTLVGLVADSTSNTSDSSVAIIESSGGQNTYGINQKVDGTSAIVHQIFIDRVILSVSGRFETLMLEGIEYSTSIPGSANEMQDDLSAKANEQAVSRPEPRPDAKPDRPAPPQKVDRRNDVELSQSLRKQREDMLSDPKKIMDYIRIRPERRNGELKGYRLSPGKDPSLFSQVGLKRNDLAVTINGYDLTDMKQALTVMKELRTMTEANITVLRDDAPVEIILAL
jgi:general secretion pathway protein C